MGGHGGLNILPQKRWNVYNRDNREKVERDKRLAEEKQKEKETRAQHARAELRYDILRAKKLQVTGGTNQVDRPKSTILKLFLFV